MAALSTQLGQSNWGNSPMNEAQKFEQLVQQMAPDSKLVRLWELTGGVSAQVTALEIERVNGRREKIVVRQHGEADLRGNPQIAADEFKLLQQLKAAGLPVPAPYYLDQPYLVVEYIEGTTEFNPANLSDFIVQFATQLARIHRLTTSDLDLSFLPKQATIVAEKLGQRPTILDDSLDEGRIRDALESVWPLPQQNQAVLLHGDYWPGNLLWRVGQLAAVLDWEDAAVGDPLSDVGNGRLELLWAFGKEAIELFTNCYKSLTTIDFTNLPYWDLYAALRPASKLSQWGLDPDIEQKMRQRHKWFVEQALSGPR